MCFFEHNKTVCDEILRKEATSTFKYDVLKPISFLNMSLQDIQELNKQATIQMVVNGFNRSIFRKIIRKQSQHLKDNAVNQVLYA